MNTGGIIIVVLLACGIAYWYFQISSDRRRRARFAHRSKPIFDEWFNIYFPNLDGESRVFAESLLNELANVIGITATQIVPDDEIDAMLSSIVVGFDDDIGTVIDEVTADFEQNKGKRIVFDNGWTTVRDIIVGVSSQIRERKGYT